MPYITTERVAEIRNEIKATFPDFTFSISRHHGSTVQCYVLSGPIDLTSNENGRTDYSVNVYWVKDHYKNEPTKLIFFSMLLAIMARDQRELVNDGDYGSVPTFYTSLCVGKDQPYQLRKPRFKENLTAPFTAPDCAGDIASIKHNDEFNGVEIYFTGKPSDDVISHLKSNGFRAKKYGGKWYWYKKVSESAINVARRYGKIPSSLDKANIEVESTDPAAAMIEEEQESLFSHFGL